MEIKREHYLQMLRDRMHNGMIKIITGIRRSGKSYLLFHLFRNELLAKGVPEDHIISLSMDGWENRAYCNPDVTYHAIKEQIEDDDDYYVLLDEVQLMDHFVEVLNSMLHMENVDTYVTGSNSKFLSKDVITEFRGRGDEVHIYPLTFEEFMQVYDGEVFEGWSEYIKFGGLPRTITLKNPEQKSSYLTRLFQETYLRDIIERNHIEKTEELDELLQVVASAIGSLTNPSKILATFQSKTKSSISINTIHQYLEYFEDAFLINHARRYDIKGRKYIGAPLKYYFEDVGLRNACLGFRQVEETHLMENILYNELRYRGFSVDVGTVKKQVKKDDGRLTTSTLEVDFVANLASRRLYIQSVLRSMDDEKRKQEKASLLAFKDAFPKLILVRDIVPNYHDYDGILTMNLFDFLLHKEHVI